MDKRQAHELVKSTLQNNVDEETKDLMTDYDIDQDRAEHVKDIMEEEGLDEDEAMELEEEL